MYDFVPVLILFYKFFFFFLTHYQVDMDVEVNCTCGAGPMRLLVSRTERNYMRRFYKCLLGKVWTRKKMLASNWTNIYMLMIFMFKCMSQWQSHPVLMYYCRIIPGVSTGKMSWCKILLNRYTRTPLCTYMRKPTHRACRGLSGALCDVVVLHGFASFVF
jgi:hypothetical protein